MSSFSKSLVWTAVSLGMVGVTSQVVAVSAPSIRVTSVGELGGENYWAPKQICGLVENGTAGQRYFVDFRVSGGASYPKVHSDYSVLTNPEGVFCAIVTGDARGNIEFRVTAAQ